MPITKSYVVGGDGGNRKRRGWDVTASSQDLDGTGLLNSLFSPLSWAAPSYIHQPSSLWFTIFLFY